MALVLVDTNIWARRLEKQSPLCPVARQALSTITARGDDLVIAPQTLYELWVVMTRPATARGGLNHSPEEARRLIGGICRVARILPDSAAILPEWQRIVSTYRVIGVNGHDARLVAAMRVHGVTQILTFNTKDFTRYSVEGIATIDPANV
jgi:predicted nucleic acid-binding protein